MGDSYREELHKRAKAKKKEKYQTTRSDVRPWPAKREKIRGLHSRKSPQRHHQASAPQIRML